MAERAPSPDENDSNSSPTQNSDADNQEITTTLDLDLGDEQSKKVDSNRLGRQQNTIPVAGSSDAPKREDNPFSFKHFLQNDSNAFQHKGAKPKAKVYCDGRPINSISDINLLPNEDEKPSRMLPEFSSALPDFVQDHLIVEQCYLGNTTNNFNLDMDNLPDFATSGSSKISKQSCEDTRVFKRSELIKRSETNEFSIPLDLPIRPQANFPLDLPFNISPQQINGRNGQTISEVGVSKSLPDFLTDGAVHGQNSDNAQLPVSPERETERLRHELEVVRRELVDQTRRADLLNVELEVARNKEHEYTQNLVKALEQVEENLERSNKRAASAECTIVKLRQEIKSLTMEINSLKLENKSLRDEEGAVGGAGYFTAPNELHYQRLAQELRTAASTAEHSLRQLLTGVDNLRIMAASLENIHRIEEKDDNFLGLDDERSGPAL